MWQTTFTHACAVRKIPSSKHVGRQSRLNEKTRWIARKNWVLMQKMKGILPYRYNFRLPDAIGMRIQYAAKYYRIIVFVDVVF